MVASPVPFDRHGQRIAVFGSELVAFQGVTSERLTTAELGGSGQDVDGVVHHHRDLDLVDGGEIDLLAHAFTNTSTMLLLTSRLRRSASRPSDRSQGRLIVDLWPPGVDGVDPTQLWFGLAVCDGGCCWWMHTVGRVRRPGVNVSDYTINETPGETQPTDAVLGMFEDGRSAAEIGDALVSAGIDGSRIDLYEGEAGAEAYGARASRLMKVFDDTSAPIRYELEAGGVAVVVHCVDETAATDMVELLERLGAANVHVFGGWVVQE
jgi:hypothetical protein